MTFPVDGPYRASFDTWLMHVEDQPGDSLVLFGLGVSANEQFAVIRNVRASAPYLLAGDDVLVAVEYGTGAQRGKIGPCPRFGESLTPDVVALEDSRQVKRSLLVGALGDQRGASVHHANEIRADVGRPSPHVLLEIYELLRRREPAASELFRPGQPGVTRVVQLALPCRVVGSPHE